MQNEHNDLLKQMAVNAGAQVWEERLGEINFVNDGALCRFARAIAEVCAKRAENRGDKVSAEVIRNIYREQA